MLEYSPSGLWQFEVARTFLNFEIISVVLLLLDSFKCNSLQEMEGGYYFASQNGMGNCTCY